MTLPLKLGAKPEPLEVHLYPGANFIARLGSQTAAGVPVDWPPGTTLRLSFQNDLTGFSDSWNFTFSADIATVVIPAEETIALPADALEAHLWLDYGDGEFLWCAGHVVRYD